MAMEDPRVKVVLGVDFIFPPFGLQTKTPFQVIHSSICWDHTDPKDKP